MTRWLSSIVAMVAVLTVLVALPDDAGTATMVAADEVASEPQAPLFVADQEGRIVELGDDGGAVRTVAGPEATGGQVGSLAVSVDGRDLWFARHDPLAGLPCHSVVVRVPVSGGPTQSIDQGFGPVPGPEGRRLAYVATSPRAGGTCAYALAVRHVDTGSVERWPLDPAWAEAYGICSLAWVDSDDRLVVEVCAEADSVLHAVELDEAGSIGDGTVLGPADPSRSWSTVAAAAGGRVVAVEYLFEDGPLPAAAVGLVEARPGAELRPLFRLDELASVADLDTDASGRQIAYVELGSGPDGTPQWRLVRWNGVEAAELRDGVVAVAW